MSSCATEESKQGELQLLVPRLHLKSSPGNRNAPLEFTRVDVRPNLRLDDVQVADVKPFAKVRRPFLVGKVEGESARVQVSQPNSIGVWAFAPTTSQFALKVTGKVSFSRSGRRAVAARKSYLLVPMVGVTSSSKVFAVLATSESGRWVRAVVPTTGKFYVYFNLALASSAVVSYFVLD